MRNDFEDFLMQKFGERNPHVLDDEWPEGFSEWLCELGVDEWIELANLWGKHETC